jgi:short-subunit dehydrogenase
MHVAVTGASAGIGEAIVREFAKRGAKVTLVARRKDRLDAIAKEIGGETFVAEADLTQVETACDWIAPAEAALGPIDVLVNNAGVQIVEPAELTTADRGEELLRVDLFVPLRLTRHLLPAMIARGSGCIVDIASMAAFTPLPGMFYYNAAKGGLGNASEGLRNELRNTGVHVVTVYPGPVDTDMGRRGLEKYEKTLATSISPVGTSDELARLVCKAVARRKARVIYPRSMIVARWFPNLARWFTLRFAPPLKRALPAPRALKG